VSLVSSFEVGGIRCSCLTAGTILLDGGAMFGVVARPLWEKHFAPDERNRIRLVVRCLLVEHDEGPILIDTGVGNKGDEKFRKIYGVENTGTNGPTMLEDALFELGIAPGDVRYVINTHLHFDHAGGNTFLEGEAPAVPPPRRAAGEGNGGGEAPAVPPSHRAAGEGNGGGEAPAVPPPRRAAGEGNGGWEAPAVPPSHRAAGEGNGGGEAPAVPPSRRAAGEGNGGGEAPAVPPSRRAAGGERGRGNGEGAVRVSFPNATYVVQRGELEAANNPNERTSASYLPDNIEPITAAGAWRLLDGQEEIVPGIEALPTPGHTPFHQSILIRDSGETACFAGDSMPTAAHAPVPWIMAYDLEPLVMLDTKRDFLARAEAERWTMVLEHDPDVSLARIVKGSKSYECAPLDTGSEQT